MSATDQSELTALLALEGAMPSSLPDLDPLSEEKKERQNEDEKSEISGQVNQANRTSLAVRLTPGYRKRICDLALPALAEGATLAEIAADCGVDAPTLRGWLIAIDEPAYREALAGQIGVMLARHDASMGECITQSEDAMRRTLSFETVSINGGKFPKDVLVGPIIAKVAQSRAEILSTAARLLHWQAEKRLPKLFSSDETAGAGPVRASFSFIINGQPAPGGRVIQSEDRSTNEQAERSATLLDIMPVISAMPTYPQDDGRVIPNLPADGSDPMPARPDADPAREKA